MGLMHTASLCILHTLFSFSIQIIAINGISLVGLPLSTCQNYIKVRIGVICTFGPTWSLFCLG